MEWIMKMEEEEEERRARELIRFAVVCMQPVKKGCLCEISSGKFSRRRFIASDCLNSVFKFSAKYPYAHIFYLPKLSVKLTPVPTLVWEVAEKKMGCDFTSASEKGDERSKIQNWGSTGNVPQLVEVPTWLWRGHRASHTYRWGTEFM